MSEPIIVELCVQGEWTADGQLLAAARDEIQQLRAEVARLRLTDAEREAVEYFSQWCIGPSKRLERYAATMRGLLERLK